MYEDAFFTKFRESEDSEENDNKWIHFINNIKGDFEKSFPLVRVSNSKYRDKAWICKDIKKHCKKKYSTRRILIIKSKSISTLYLCKFKLRIVHIKLRIKMTRLL